MIIIIIIQTTVNCYSKMTLNLYTLLVFKFSIKKASYNADRYSPILDYYNGLRAFYFLHFYL